MMKVVFAAWILYAQGIPVLDLEGERRNAIGPQFKSYLITIVARHKDGTPARGFISCDGWWVKYGDGKQDDSGEPVWGLPFKTDARGAVHFNPVPGETYFNCVAEDEHGHGGSVTNEDVLDAEIMQIIVK